MSPQERHKIRDALARRNGYRPVKTAEDPEWAGARLQEPVDERAAEAARALRGLLPQKEAA